MAKSLFTNALEVPSGDRKWYSTRRIRVKTVGVRHGNGSEKNWTPDRGGATVAGKSPTLVSLYRNLSRGRGGGGGDIRIVDQARVRIMGNLKNASQKRRGK